MEYLPGKTLRDLLNERGRLNSREAVDILLPVLSALGAAHRAGLIHRDVKPENVLLTTDGQVKVADFGLARAESDSKQTKTGVMIGTVAYMAPEQVINGQADARSDVYAAGILLFELITGRQPHQADTPLSVAYKHVNEQVPLPSSLVPGVPQRIDALVASATNRDAARRPVDANHFYSLVSDTSLAIPVQGPTQPPSPDNATSVLSVPAMTNPSNNHTSVFQGSQFPPEDPVPALDRIMYFVTGRFVLVALGLIAAMVIGWAIWYQVAGQYDHVPNLIGLELDAAEAKLSSDGIKYAVGKKDYFDTVKAGQIGRVDPGSGTRIKPGQTVTIFASKGRLPRTVPPVKGTTQDDARKTLQNAGFTNVAAAVSYRASADIEKDKVVAADPKEGTKVSPDEQITLIVSKGVVMPDVVGLPKNEAWTALSKLGLNISVNEDQRDGSKPTGTVLSQSPAKDIPVKAGDAVTIFVNKPDCLIQFIDLFCNDDNSKDEHGNKRIPRLAGKSVDEAAQILQQHGFQVSVQHQFNSGRIVRMQPNGGEKAPEGSVVTIWD